MGDINTLLLILLDHHTGYTSGAITQGDNGSEKVKEKREVLPNTKFIDATAFRLLFAVSHKHACPLGTWSIR